MGLGWQQGPLAPGAIGTFLLAEPLPERLLYAEPLRRRVRVMFGGAWIAQSDDMVILHEPGRYPVAYFPKADIPEGILEATERTTAHPELGLTAWYAVRQTSRHLVVRAGDEVVAETHRPLVLYESGFAPRWYLPREDVNEQLLAPGSRQTFCPYKGLCDYYDIGVAGRAAWSYRDAYREVDRIDGLISFEPDKVSVTIDGERLALAPGQQVVPHGADRGLTPEEAVAPAMP